MTRCATWRAGDSTRGVGHADLRDQPQLRGRDRSPGLRAMHGRIVARVSMIATGTSVAVYEPVRSFTRAASSGPATPAKPQAVMSKAVV